MSMPPLFRWFLERIPLFLAWVTIVVSILVMIGWFLDIEILKRIVPDLVTMKFATAFSFFFSGFILLYSSLRELRNSQWAEVVLPGATFVVLLLMGTTFLSVLFGFKTGIEDLFVMETAEAILTTVPGRPSIGTMLAFIVIASLGLVTFGINNWRIRVRFYIFAGAFVMLLGVLALVGYALAQPLLFYAITDISTAMAIHTALLFIFLGGGYIALAKDLGQSKKVLHEA